MSIDFGLSAEQMQLRAKARSFALDVLAPAADHADAIPDPQEAFVAMRPVYRIAVESGLTAMYLPREYGGGGASNVDFLLAIEELCAADPGFATTILVNGLALLPILWFGSDEQRDRWIGRACSPTEVDFLAGWVVSERGGTANFDHPSPRAGIQLLAQHHARSGEFVLNGEKHWPANSGGWDLRGAEINVGIARTDRTRGGEAALSVFIVERGTAGIEYEVIDKIGHRTCQNVTMTFRDVRIPERNVFAVGDGDLVIQRTFTWSSPIASIAAVAVARSAYDFTLKWARTYTGGGRTPIINHQAVGNLLVDIASRIEAGRYMCWKTAHYMDVNPGQGHGLGGMNKSFCGDLMQRVVTDCMRVVGVNALDKRFPLAKLYRDAAVFSLYDAGNIAMQRRRAWGTMADSSFSPDTFVNSDPLEFTRSMQQYGLD